MNTDLITAFSSAWKRSFDYTGRSDRGDYWLFVLANFIILLVLNIIGSFVPFIGVLTGLYIIAELVPHLSLSVRRLRDAGKTRQWIFLFIPGIFTFWQLNFVVISFCFIAYLWLLYLHTLPSKPLLLAG